MQTRWVLPGALFVLVATPALAYRDQCLSLETRSLQDRGLQRGLSRETGPGMRGGIAVFFCFLTGMPVFPSAGEAWCQSTK
jgi:hypothetical protein